MAGISAGSGVVGGTDYKILNKLQYAFANRAADITTATTSDYIVFIDTSDDYEVKFGDSANAFELLGVTATAAELNAAADVSGRVVAITDAATYTALAANSGKPHFLPDLTASCTISLPTASAGLEFAFYYKGVAADAQNWVIDTGADANFFLGGLVHLDTDAGSAGDEIVPIAGDGNSNSKLTIVTPDVGTWVKCVCDGTNWILSGYAVSATVPSFADQA